MIQPLFNGMLTLLLAKFVMNDLPHAAGLSEDYPIKTDINGRGPITRAFIEARIPDAIMFKVEVPHRIEHRTYRDRINYSPASGAFFALPGYTDPAFGPNVFTATVRSGTTMYQYYSSFDFMTRLGLMDVKQVDLIRKYEEDIPDIRQYPTLKYLWDNLDRLRYPGAAYVEIQHRAVRIIRRTYNPDIVNFTDEDELILNQFVVLRLDALKDITVVKGPMV